MQGLSRIELLIDQKRYDMAVELLNQYLAEQPNDSDALALLAMCKLNLKEAVKAIEIAKNALGSDPNNAFAHYLIANAHFSLLNYKRAEEAINEAIAIDPIVSDYYGVLANVKLARRDFQEAIEAAQNGLKFNPEDLMCRNALSTAQLKIGQKEEAFNTIDKALEIDPHDANTHATLGWAQLEKGSHKAALNHFAEALSMNPMNEYAKVGMLEALKAKYWLYRIFLRFFFFMSNLKPGVQWGVIVGIILINKILVAGAESTGLSAILLPLSYLLTFFVVTTWIIQPLFNFFMSINVYSRNLLNELERTVSAFVGISFIIFVLALVGWIFTRSEVLLATMIIGYTLILPIGRIADAHKTWVKYFVIVFSLAMVAVGVIYIGAATGPAGSLNINLEYYIFPMVGFTWVWNFINTR